MFRSCVYYASSGTRTRRRVEPGKLVFKSGCWYKLGGEPVESIGARRELSDM